MATTLSGPRLLVGNAVPPATIPPPRESAPSSARVGSFWYASRRFAARTRAPNPADSREARRTGGPRTLDRVDLPRLAASDPALADPLDQALDLLAGRPLVALTGAGLSTDSGIPDYRGPSSPRRTPMTYTEFVSGPAAQRRYWARSHVGWARMARAEPNAGHRAVAALEHAGVLHGVITQNVDGLHRAAGSRAVIDLHGRIADVVCLGCRRRQPAGRAAGAAHGAQPRVRRVGRPGRGGRAGR